MPKTLALILCVIGLTACDNTGFQVLSDEGLVFRYGRFCGKNWPVLHATEERGKVAELLSIQPVDSLDLACKEHDLCYAIHGFSTPACDDVLLKRMQAMQFNDPRCAQIARNIGAFGLSNPGQLGHGRLNVNAAINTPVVIAENMAQQPFDLVGKVFGMVPAGQPICISGNGPYHGPKVTDTSPAASNWLTKKLHLK